MKTYPVWVLLFLMLLSCIGAHCQEEPKTHSKKAIDSYNAGLQNYSLHDYSLAEKYFLDAIDADTLFIDAYLVLAEMYEDMNQPLKAINIYKRGLAINDNYYPYGFIKLGFLQYRQGFYKEAKASYEHFISLKTGDVSHEAKALDGIKRCDFSIYAMEHPVDFHPVNLGPNVNTKDDEYWPSLSADEQTLVITRLVRGDQLYGRLQEDFYISHREGDGWSVAKDFGYPLNTNDNEGAQTLSADGRFMVFTACNRKDGYGRCDLYYSVREGDQWSVPKNMGRPVNSAYRETQPSLSADGRTLYFSSDRPGGKGLHDIWVSKQDESGNWGQPQNLGDTINTPGQEMSPFIHPDNKTLYFSSDGQIGLGGYDIFVSRADSNGRWGKPENLGYPINTNKDEIGLIVNARGNKAYYSSNMNPETGKDIYVFDLPVQDRPAAVNYMKGRVFNADNREPLKAQFELIDLQSDKLLYKSFSDSLSGEFILCIPTNRDYMLNVSKPGYLFYSDNFSLHGIYKADQPYLKDVPLQLIEVGKSIVLKNIFYETNSYALKKESKAELQKVVQFLKDNPEIRIEIMGHTDNIGGKDYNQKLSENRAKTVADYLINSSVEAERITYKGFGMDMPVAPNDSEQGRAQNRRTEMKIIQ